MDVVLKLRDDPYADDPYAVPDHFVMNLGCLHVILLQASLLSCL